MSTRVILACHHALEFQVAPPLLGSDVWCFRCQRMIEVTEAPPEFRVRCLQCPYGCRTGNARLLAETRAARHLKKKGHKVGIYNGHRRIYVMGQNDKRQLELPLTYQEPMLPPF